VILGGAAPNVSSAREFRWKPPLPSRRDISQSRVRVTIAASTAWTLAMSVNSISP